MGNSSTSISRAGRPAPSGRIDITPLINPRSDSGYQGVSRHHSGRYWRARFKADNRLQEVGRGTTPEAAARVMAEFYHAFYGERWAEMIRLRKRIPWHVAKTADGGYKAIVHLMGRPFEVTGRFVGDRTDESRPGLWTTAKAAKRACRLAMRKWRRTRRAALLRR